MFRPHPISLLCTRWSFAATALVSTLLVWAGLSWAQLPAPLAFDAPSGGASIVVTDAPNDGDAMAPRENIAACSCTDDGCYARDTFWKTLGRRCCRPSGCGLGICAGLPRGDCGCCGDGCGVLGGCMTIPNLGHDWTACGGRLRARLSGSAGGSRLLSKCGNGFGQEDACPQPLAASGDCGQSCGQGGILQEICDACRDRHRQRRDRCRDLCRNQAKRNTAFCGMPAPRYPVPFRTPQYVGYHQFTYPPMMPHNSLPHYRNTYSFRHGSGLEHTTVNWQPRYIKNALRQVHQMFYLPR